jgi:starch synthase
LFVNSKLVYSVYNDDFSKPLNKSFKNKIIIDGINKKDITILENPDFTNLSKLAIQYSDGLIIGNPNVNEALKEHIAASGKSWLPFNGMENYIDEYADFYEKVLAENNG